jgi:antitoxin (DNA-binding transcriptional repressor) of toxin-antitoxin stability system
MDVPRPNVQTDGNHPAMHFVLGFSKRRAMLTPPKRSCTMYIMKRVTASEARRDWFRLLDEVAAGEVVVVERKGRRIVIQREAKGRSREATAPDYSAVLRVPAPDLADTWTWEWNGQDGELRPRGGTRG